MASNIVTGGNSKLYILNFDGDEPQFQVMGLDYSISDFTVFPSLNQSGGEDFGRVVRIFTVERSPATQDSSGTVRGYKNSGQNVNEYNQFTDLTQHDIDFRTFCPTKIQSDRNTYDSVYLISSCNFISNTETRIVKFDFSGGSKVVKSFSLGPNMTASEFCNFTIEENPG